MPIWEFPLSLGCPTSKVRKFWTLSDEDGFASGRTSDILTVGPSPGGAACNTSVHAPAFFFSDDVNVLAQCQCVLDFYPAILKSLWLIYIYLVSKNRRDGR